MLDFQDGVNHRDADKVSDVIHEDAMLMLGRERKPHSKSDYIKILPRRLADQPPIALGRPKMDVSGDTADVRGLAVGADGVVVLHRGRIVYERYMGGLDETGKHAAMSMTKLCCHCSPQASTHW